MATRICRSAGRNSASQSPSALAVKRANGERVGSVPYGFDLALDGRTLVENKHEQAVICEVRAMRDRGITLAKIADVLTERGVPTKTGKSDQWRHQAVVRILRRDAGA